MLELELLKSSGAFEKNYSKGSSLFNEGDTADYFFHLIKGSVKLSKRELTERELIFSVLNSGDEIAAFMLFNKKPYWFSALALTNCTVLVMEKKQFVQLFYSDKFLTERLIADFSTIINDLLELNRILFTKSPSVKLHDFFTLLKGIGEEKKQFSYEVDLTRQQIANMTGLRVETVIRTIKRMEKEHILEIQRGKIYF